MMIARAERLAAALVATLGLLPAPCPAAVEASLTLASAYLHRGLEYNGSGPTWQGSLEYQAGGWFTGLWASNVDFGGYDQRTSEIDYYLGYSRRLSPWIALEGAVVHYTYQGDSPRSDDWTELQLSAYLGDRWTLTGGIADNWWAAGTTSHFIEGTFRHPLPARLILDATAGYQMAERAADVNYGYAAAGLSRRLDDVVLRAGYAAVSADAEDRFRGFAQNRWLLSVTWQP